MQSVINTAAEGSAATKAQVKALLGGREVAEASGETEAPSDTPVRQAAA